ncbi:MAG: outer membrane beta-barrel protein [Paludibacter sp.]|nr:outer membrane beta-barrel protein [Paludibacter sp.]
MKQFCLLASFLILTSLSAIAQHNIQSMVFDSKNSLPLELATVRLMNATDSSLIQGSRTNINGEFILSKVKPGNYTLIISCVGYIDHIQNLKMDAKDILLKHIQMQENAHVLSEVEVKGNAAQLVVKGDTTEYNATAFKTQQNAVVEDLLKKMPGVEVSSEGKITVNGQEIKKIRVDGKKFFDGDIEMTTKNLPAEMIDKIQVYDNKSDMAKLTGFEDNDTERIINLTTKANRKHGVFGTITGGGGSDLGNADNQFRYDGNGFVRIMNNDVQTAITASANNTNTSRSERGRSGMGNPSGGISETQNLGVNNNTVISPKLSIGGDASLNHSDNLSNTETDKNSYLKGSTSTNHSKNNNSVENYSANMRLEVEWKPDTLNTFIIQPNIGYNRSFSGGNSNYTYLTDSVLTSVGNSWSRGDGSSVNANINLIYNHRFTSKKGRNLTANLQSGVSQSNNESWNISSKTSLGTQTDINHYINNNNNSSNASLRLSYVEPLWNVRNLLEAALSARTTNNDSEKNQYNKDANGTYFARDTAYTIDNTYSNTFRNKFYSETMELNYRYVAKDFNLMLGAKAEPSQTEYTRHYANGLARDTTYGVFNLSPTGRFQYNFSKKKFARIDYRGQTNQASISQMQPVKNNSNLMNEVVGNPNLNPEFNHNLRLFYTAFNDSTFSSLSVMMNAQVTKDALITNSIYDSTGKQFSQTLNATTDLPYRVFTNFMFSTPLIKKSLHFNTNTTLSLNRKIGYSKKLSGAVNVDNLILGDLSDTKQYGASEALSLTYTNDVIELGTRGTFGYSDAYNTLSKLRQQTYDWTISGNFVAHLPYSTNLASDINYSTMQGYAGFDKNQLIWNASIDKSFFKNKGVLSLKVFDILHQKLNVRQTIGDNFIQYSSFNTITSYFLLSFSYKINEFKGNRDQNNRRDFQRFGPGGDFPRREGRGGQGGGGGFGGGPMD